MFTKKGLFNYDPFLSCMLQGIQTHSLTPMSLVNLVLHMFEEIKVNIKKCLSNYF